MSYCAICGDLGNENTLSFRSDIGRSLCKSCASTTPKKMRRSEFDKRYWGKDVYVVPESTRRDFYDDYRFSDSSFEEYVKQTTRKEL